MLTHVNFGRVIMKPVGNQKFRNENTTVNEKDTSDNHFIPRPDVQFLQRQFQKEVYRGTT